MVLPGCGREEMNPGRASCVVPRQHLGSRGGESNASSAPPIPEAFITIENFGHWAGCATIETWAAAIASPITLARCSFPSSLDHLVGFCQQRLRHRQSK